MLATKWRCFEFYITKKSVFAENFFLFKKPKLHFGRSISLKNMFWFVCRKKAFLLIFVAKMRGIRLYSTKTRFWSVCCNIGLFLVLLYQKVVFFQYAGTHPDFLSIFLKQRFAFFWLSYAVSESSFWGQPCSLFLWPNYTLDALYYWKTCYGLFAVKFFPAIIHRKNVFCLFALSHFDFTWLYSKQTFLFIFG